MKLYYIVGVSHCYLTKVDEAPSVLTEDIEIDHHGWDGASIEKSFDLLSMASLEGDNRVPAIFTHQEIESIKEMITSDKASNSRVRGVSSMDWYKMFVERSYNRLEIVPLVHNFPSNKNV